MKFLHTELFGNTGGKTQHSSFPLPKNDIASQKRVHYNFREKNKFRDLSCIFYRKSRTARAMSNPGLLLAALSRLSDLSGFRKIDFKGKNTPFKGERSFYFGSDYVTKGNVFLEH